MNSKTLAIAYLGNNERFFLVLNALSCSFLLLLSTNRGFLVMLLTTKITHDVILLALSLKTLKRAFQRLVFADSDYRHSYTTFVHRTRFSLDIILKPDKFVKRFAATFQKF